MRTILRLTVLAGILAAVLARAAGTNDEAVAMLRAADRARGNLDGVVWSVHVVAAEEGAATRSNAYRVKARGFDVLAEVLEPARQKGNKLLMHAGNMWFAKPDLSKPVPISQRQRLAGSAANGDLAATNYAEDYEPSAVTAGEVDGEPCRVFDLKARPGRSCTYDRVVDYVSVARRVGVRAEYFTSSGKLIKTARMAYDNTVAGADGRPAPFISGIVIRDAIVTNSTTAMAFSAPLLQTLAPETFDVNLLRR
jgi:hypothetical protein